MLLLYLPTQTCFLIGGEPVTCQVSKLNSLGKQLLEPFNSHMIRSNTLKRQQICASQPLKAFEVGQCFSLEEAFTIQEKGFIIAKTYQSNKGEKIKHFVSSSF